MNAIMKPVWRLNTGNGVPSDLGFKMVTKTLRMGRASESHKDDNSFWSLDRPDQLAVYADQTTRTKAAKYERVGCISGCIYGCSCCNGKGYTLEKIE